MRKENKELRFKTKLLLISRLLFWWLSFRRTETRTNLMIGGKNRVLVIQSHLIGDVVIATGLINNLKKQYPNIVVDLLASNHARDLLKYDKNVNEIIVIDFPWSSYNYSLINILKLLIMAIKLKKRKYDLSIDLRGDLRNIILMRLIGAKKRLSFNSSGGESLLTDVIEESNEAHLNDYNISILKYLNVNGAEGSRPNLVYSEKELLVVDEYLSSNKICKYHYIVINPGASYQSKRWPSGKLLSLGRVLVEKYKLPIIWNLPKGIAFPVCPEGKYIFSSSLVGIFPLLDHCAFYIGMDSGVAHIAGAFNVPSIVLFGPQLPELSRPINRHVEVVVKSCSERPCSKKICEKRPTCLDLIDVNDVVNAVENLRFHWQDRDGIG